MGAYTIYTNKEEQKRHWSRLRCYTVFNDVRFIVLATIICAYNVNNQQWIEEYQDDCCRCYFIAQHASEYDGIAENQRVDLSYCVPECADCNYCERGFPDDSTSFANVDRITCNPLAVNYSYNKPFLGFSSDWSAKTGCPRYISIVTLQFFPKDYPTYGVLIVVLVVLYIAITVSLVYCCKAYSGLYSGAPIFVWNVIICINAVYTMFKPMQYYHKKIYAPDGVTFADCELDSIDETTETMLTICVSTSIIFMVLQWVTGMVNCLTTRRIKASHGRRCCDIDTIKSVYENIEKAQLIFAAVLAVVFLIVMGFASVNMINKRVEEQSWTSENKWALVLVIVVDLLSLSACVDIFCYKFCRTTCCYYFGRTRPWSGKGAGHAEESRDFRELRLGSIDGQDVADTADHDQSFTVGRTMTSREQDSLA